jgi:hypothetical protein
LPHACFQHNRRAQEQIPRDKMALRHLRNILDQFTVATAMIPSLPTLKNIGRNKVS